MVSKYAYINSSSNYVMPIIMQYVFKKLNALLKGGDGELFFVMVNQNFETSSRILYFTQVKVADKSKCNTCAWWSSVWLSIYACMFSDGYKT